MSLLPFDRKVLKIASLSSREHDLDISTIKELTPPATGKISKPIRKIARRICAARAVGAAVVMMVGGHVIRAGVQKFIIDLMERGYIRLLAMNGAGMIHDFEFSMIGATTESVAKYVKNGQFGLWRETGELNDIIRRAYERDNGLGMGSAVGEAMDGSDFPHKDISLLHAGYRLGTPVTVHVSIGQDIIHEHPNCDGAATGSLSYNDFLAFASMIGNLEQGVVMNFGSAVMGPEVFLKALSMARNLAHQNGDAIRRFTALVCDLHDLPVSVSGEPAKDDVRYYFRPWKTLLVRTVREGGEGVYIRGTHHETVPSLWAAINEEESK